MSPRAGLELAAIAAMALLGFGACHQYKERLRAEGAYEILKARADSMAEVSAAAVKASEARDSARAAVDRREAAARAEADRRVRAAAARLPAASDRVVAAAAPSDTAAVRARLAELEAVYEERDAARLARIASDSVVIAELRALDVTRLAAIRSLEGALAASQAAAGVSLETRPGWLERTGKKVLVGLAIAGAFLAGQRIGG